MNSEDPKALTFQDLEIGYGRTRVAGPLNGRLESGLLWALTGPNGSGKTTLLRTLIGLQPPLAGSVHLPSAHAVSYVPQLGVMDEAFPVSVQEVIGMGIRRRVPRGERRGLISEALTAVDLPKARSQSFLCLSGGERQRVLVARALISDAAVVALDEPTSGVDADGSKRLWELLASIAADGRLVMVSTHDHFHVQHHAQRVLELAEGALRSRVA